MEQLFADHLSLAGAVFLVLALGLALGFEFVNGFHDTANAVATVIYTHSLRPYVAVIWSGLWNFVGVVTSTGAVAYSIIQVLPVELVINVGSGAGFAMVFALLVSAILWNLGTWYRGLPASSSHTLLGSIMGVGLMSSMIAGGNEFGEGVNWAKVDEVGMTLLVSPVVGFFGAALILLLAKLVIRNPLFYRAPEGGTPPPWWIRGILVLTCTGVSFAHGSNDGQKGMGLFMLILIGILPATYALDRSADRASIAGLAAASDAAAAVIEKAVRAPLPDLAAADEALSRYLKTTGVLAADTFAGLLTVVRDLRDGLTGPSLDRLPPERLRRLRSDIYLIAATVAKLDPAGVPADPDERRLLRDYRERLLGLTNFIPLWVKLAVALALGFGTMIGWKRIVVTIGEKIGQEKLSYAKGASAELVTMLTIGAADRFGLPVSTTHVLSSGVAGTMAANRSGLQWGTLRNLVLAWVLTLPACVFLGSALFAAGLFFTLKVLGIP